MNEREKGALNTTLNGLWTSINRLNCNIVGNGNNLSQLRYDLRHVPIMPFPNRVLAVVLSANVAQDVEVPQGVKIVSFRGDGDYYVSVNGNAQIPSVTDQSGQASLFWPEDQFFYVEGIRSISLISSALTRVVTVHCYTN